MAEYYSNHYTTESTDPVVQEFIVKFKAKYNEVPDSMAALGYDSARILVEAIQRCSSLVSEKIRNEIAKTKNFVGVTGKITLNEQRNADKSAVIVQVENEKRKFVTTVSP